MRIFLYIYKPLELFERLALIQPFIGGLIAGVVGSAASSALGQRSANKQMDFQEKMSNTSYQRAMSDMKAAGLNPMLAYQQGGASTPTGASTGMPNVDIAGQQASLNSAKQTKAQTEVTKAQATSAQAQADLDKAVANKIKNDPKARQAYIDKQIFGTTVGGQAKSVENVVDQLFDESGVSKAIDITTAKGVEIYNKLKKFMDPLHPKHSKGPGIIRLKPLTRK